ncbi:sugar ABC transporter ATP-binding protein [Herbiconiux solani]|uniref:sugar ABC transporter ATP-binding protein n=1 Tax=Herbiconiux solani TaxID=661329 RepID=UPI00082550B8|nr:sugar ABC transporter ATP-binding protein [Herbiconiux solani]
MPVLQIAGVSKRFFGFSALSGVDLTVEAGEVHALVGENGAGKSTLMKILAGVDQADEGTIELEGRPVSFAHPAAAYAAGISTVFQEFTLLPERTVAQNIYLGREPRRRGVVSASLMNRRAAELLESMGVHGIHPADRVGALSVAQQQIVEIAKALSYEPRVISMDEPTAALAEHEVDLLYGIIRRLADRGVAVLYVSHRLREIFDLCDRITVLKDGALVATTDSSAITEDELVRLMVGRSLSTVFPARGDGDAPGEVVLQLDGCGNGSVDAIDLTVRAGEIVGLAGLQGAGRTEVLEGISGAVPFSRGRMRLDGAELTSGTPARAIRAGVAHLTEDRKGTGLALGQTILDNALSVTRAVRRTPRAGGGAAQASGGAALASGGSGRVARLTALLDDLELAARGPDQEVRYLSGGNQQKVVLAKWLLTEPRVILLDEPTRGIDVGAKLAVYTVIRRLAAAGLAIVLVSSELPELIGMADRILVLHEGRIAAELPGGSDEESIARAASGLPIGEAVA